MNVFTIPSHEAFVDCLARGVMADAGADPLALASVTILLPTRRACRSLREAFLRLSDGKPLLLPRLVPLSDLDEEDALFSGFAAATEIDIPPAIAPLRRQLMLTALIQKAQAQSPEQAVQLAAELAKLLDEVQTERLNFDRLKDLVEGDYAEHWKTTLQFLELVTDAWPKILAEENALDPAAQRNAVFAAQIAAWEKGGAAGRVIAAGSTGSIPATADLLATIANMPRGCVVLPGLDQYLDADSWDALDDTHPQRGLKSLLARFGLARHQVQLWPASTDSVGRAEFVSEVMRPATTTDAWRTIKGHFKPEVVSGLTRLDCASPREEAEAIALIMRESLEVQRRTCALVTPDRALAHRVAGELKRWHIDVDDSAGQPLEQTPPGAFLQLLAVAAAESFASVATLALCKHPLAAGGIDPIEFRDLTRLAERHLLRGPRPPAGFAGLRQLTETLKEPRKDVGRWLARLESCCGEFAALMKAEETSAAELLAAHMKAAEVFAGTHDTPGPLRLWADEAGETAATFVSELAQGIDVLALLPPATYPAFFGELMSTRVVRPRYGRHPRLSILGPLEARLQRFDVLILGSLNEGTWPSDTSADPWMSRPMRARFGLRSPEERVGLAAHDISQALCAPRVVMTRAAKVGGTPTVPSRWLRRLDRVIASAGLALPVEKGAWLPWTKELTKPTHVAATNAPAPKPPVTARPRRLSVTEIEKWMRDPYSIYARHVLKLEPLDPLEQDVSAADYGSLIHRALQNFIGAYPAGDLPFDALEKLHAHGREVFDTLALRPAVMAFWWPRFERIAAWFVAHEQSRRAALSGSFVEKRGELKLFGPGGAFTLIAKADRIDRLRDGSLTIIDYKTGTPPREAEVAAGYAPQLPLEAVMALQGAFADVPKGSVSALAFWHLHGRRDGGTECFIKADVGELAAEATAGLTQLIATFDDGGTPYEARPNPEIAPTYSDYLHLARVKEWSAGDES